MSRINLNDSAEVIADKIKRAKTDTGAMPTTVEEFEGRPEVENLVTIYAALSGKTQQAVLGEFAGSQFSPFKNALAELTVEKILPIGAQMARLLADKGELERILAAGRDKAAETANKTLKSAKTAMGFVEIR
jgi:tryptophanyl-tRNA synthetase